MPVITPQMSSMKAIEAWVGIINGDVAGMVRTAFKATKPTFHGSGGAILSNSGAPGQPFFDFPEASLQVSTGVDFSQGPIVASTSKLHLALNGPGFFPVVPANSLNPLLYTRDGEFGLQAAAGGGYFLVNPQGLRLFIPSQGAPAQVASSDPAAFDPANMFTSSGAAGIEIALPPTPDVQLRYSAYGATTFEPVPPAVGFPPAGLDPANRPKFVGSNTALAQQALEGSNTDITILIPELSLAQKMFTAISKIIAAENERFDVVFNLMK